MTNLKLALAAGLAAAALALSFTNMIGGLALLQTVALATAFVIGAVVLAAAAFVISLRRGSIVVGAMLSVTGIMIMIPAMATTGYFSAMVFPGPIIGVFFGLGVIGMGVAKGVGGRQGQRPSCRRFPRESCVIYRVQSQGGFVRFLNNLLAIAINKRQNEFW
jgi:hypothetical protein